MLWGCEYIEKQFSKNTEKLEIEIASLREISKTQESEINTIKETLSKMREDISKNSMDLFFSDLKRERYENILIDLSQPQFQRLDTDTGTFFVSCQNVTNYLDGSKILLHIGNPYECDFSGLEIKCKYGKKQPIMKEGEDVKKWREEHNMWENGLLKADIKSTNKLQSGTWNIVVINLPGYKPDELGYLEFSFSIGQAIMRNPGK